MPPSHSRNRTMINSRHLGTPKYKHDCTKCRFLGQTIGGGRLTDLYICDPIPERSPTLVARFSDDEPDYFSSDANYVNPNGHAELFIANHLWLIELKEEKE